MIKFNKHFVTDGTFKARIWYGLDNHVSGKPCVILYEKDYGGKLSKIIPDATDNDSDYQSDYVSKDISRIFEDHPLYQVARKAAELKKAQNYGHILPNV